MAGLIPAVAPTPAPSTPLPPASAPPVIGANVELLPRDIERLAGVHPDLVRVVVRARAAVPFIVTEGVRTVARQLELIAAGRSRIKPEAAHRGRHITGHAVDLAPWQDRNGNRIVNADEIDWNDAAAFRELARVMLAAAEAEGVPIRWGGTFPGFFDGPHFELPRAQYP